MPVWWRTGFGLTALALMGFGGGLVVAQLLLDERHPVEGGDG